MGYSSYEIRDAALRRLKGKDYAAAPEVKTYAEPTADEQAKALQQVQRRGLNTRRIKQND